MKNTQTAKTAIRQLPDQKTPTIENGATLGELLAKHQPQAQHAPLPTARWEVEQYQVALGGAHYHVIGTNEDEIAYCLWQKDAKLIVASVNHATALAEALRDCMADLDHYASTHGPGPDRRRDKAREALARWEAK